MTLTQVQRNDLLAEARARLPVGTKAYFKEYTREWTIQEELYWQLSTCISYPGLPMVYDTYNGWADFTVIEPANKEFYKIF